MDVSRITPTLLVGSCPRGPQDAGSLQEVHGVSAVLSLQSEDDLRYWEIDWDALCARYRELGIVVRRVPILDFSPDDLRRQLPHSVQTLRDLLDAGATVFVHCNAGINRSPSVVIAYLYWHAGWDLLPAARHVQACRCCDPYLAAIVEATEDRAKELGEGSAAR